MELFQSPLETFLRKFISETRRDLDKLRDSVKVEYLCRATRTTPLRDLEADSNYVGDGSFKIKHSKRTNAATTEVVQVSKARVSFDLTPGNVLWLVIQLLRELQQPVKILVSQSEASLHFQDVRNIAKHLAIIPFEDPCDYEKMVVDSEPSQSLPSTYGVQLEGGDDALKKLDSLMNFKYGTVMEDLNVRRIDYLNSEGYGIANWAEFHQGCRKAMDASRANTVRPQPTQIPSAVRQRNTQLNSTTQTQKPASRKNTKE